MKITLGDIRRRAAAAPRSGEHPSGGYLVTDRRSRPHTMRRMDARWAAIAPLAAVARRGGTTGRPTP